jgi:Domain of unknown function (DUF4276)
MVDYYALPRSEPRAWPGRAKSVDLTHAEEKAACIEAALGTDLASSMGADFNSDRFVPFVVMHEFEGLLFSDCTAFSHSIGRTDLEGSLRTIRDQFATPEEINDSQDTAPSKRIQALVPGYQKPLLGVLAILEIGLDAIRRECPHFNGWLKKLESLV